jgi:hypothetical protein
MDSKLVRFKSLIQRFGIIIQWNRQLGGILRLVLWDYFPMFIDLLSAVKYMKVMHSV